MTQTSQASLPSLAKILELAGPEISLRDATELVNRACGVDKRPDPANTYSAGQILSALKTHGFSPVPDKNAGVVYRRAST